MKCLRRSDIKRDDFDHIIFDIQDTLPEHLTLMLYVKSYPPSEEEQMFLDLIDDYYTIKMTYDGKKEKDAINLAPLLSVWKTVEQIESFRISHRSLRKN